MTLLAASCKEREPTTISRGERDNPESLQQSVEEREITQRAYGYFHTNFLKFLQFEEIDFKEGMQLPLIYISLYEHNTLHCSDLGNCSIIIWTSMLLMVLLSRQTHSRLGSWSKHDSLRTLRPAR